jgi:iron complex outermembrane receptor protein
LNIQCSIRALTLAVVASIFVTTAMADSPASTQPQGSATPQATAAPQTAQSTGSGSDVSELSEIIVSARRRSEDVQDIPVEVSVVHGDLLRDLNVFRPQDVGNLVSGLQADPESAQRDTSVFVIRGQGSVFGTAGSGVVVYSSEVPDFLSDIFDLSDVQVLKGPQGTLFGRVTTGGAVLLQPRMPTDEFSGYADLRVGSYDEHDVEFGVGGPIIPGVLSARISGVTHNTNGFTHDIYNGTTADGTDNQAFRLIVKLDLGKFQNIDTVQYDNDADSQRGTIPLIAASLGTYKGGFPIPSPLNSLPLPAPVASAANIACPGGVCPTWYTVEANQLANQAKLGKYTFDDNAFGSSPVTQNIGVVNTSSYELADNLTLRNIASYREQKITQPGDNAQDGYAVPIVELWTVAGDGPAAITEEFQVQSQPVSALHLTTGYYYEDIYDPTYQASDVLLFGGYPGGQYIGYRNTLSKNITINQAGYFQADWTIIPRLSLTAGVRYTDAAIHNWLYNATSTQLAGQSVVPTQYIQIPGGPRDLVPADNLSIIPGVPEQKLHEVRTTYTAAVNYKLTDDVNLYVTTRSGYKPGGFNATAAAGSNAEFGPETVTDYEGGIKTRWNFMGASGTVNLAVYHDSYDNIQRSEILSNATTVTENIAAAIIRGFDLDASIQFSPAFDLTAYWSYTDAYYTKYPNSGQFGPGTEGIDLTTMALSDVSRNRWGLRPYMHLMGFGHDLPDIVLSANVYGRTSYATTNTNGILDPAVTIPGRVLADMRIDWNHVNGTHLTLSSGVTNLTNNQSLIGVVDGTNIGGYGYGLYQEPRTYYGEIHYSF